MVVKNAQAAIDDANAQTSCDPAMCLMYVRTWLGIGSREPTAFDAWQSAIGKHAGDKHPPRVRPCFGSHRLTAPAPGTSRFIKGWHMRTTDKPHSGSVGNDDGSWPRSAWGQSYLGWAEGFNGVRIRRLGTPWQASGDIYIGTCRKGRERQRQRCAVFAMGSSTTRTCQRATNHPSRSTATAMRFWKQCTIGSETSHPRRTGESDSTGA